MMKIKIPKFEMPKGNKIPKVDKKTIDQKKIDRKNNHLVTLLALTYSESQDEYRISKKKMKWCDLPHDAVHVTNQKDTYFWDCCPKDCRVMPDKDSVTAMDLYQYMVNNDLDDALAVPYKKMDNIDIKKMAIIGFALIVVLYILIGGLTK